MVKSKKNKDTEVVIEEVTKKKYSVSSLFGLALIIFVLYLFINFSFKENIPCNEDKSEKVCSCIKEAISKNVPFTKKVEALIFGMSKGEIMAYIDINILSCAFLDK